MSEQEKNSGGSAISSSTITVEKSSSRSPHKQLFRPNELQEDAENHHKRPKAPFVPSVEEKLKKLIEDSTLTDNAEIKERMERDHSVIVDSDKHKQSATKTMSSSIERREHSPEAIILAPVELDSKKGAIISPPQPIPTKVSCKSEIKEANNKSEPQSEEDSINEEIAELQTPEMANKHSEWSDDEGAGGLPRSDSRASRVSRMVQQLFCCGVAHEAPSEDNISTQRAFGQGI